MRVGQRNSVVGAGGLRADSGRDEVGGLQIGYSPRVGRRLGTFCRYATLSTTLGGVQVTKKPMTLSRVMLNSGGRRFLICLLALASAHWLAWYQHISGDAYAIVVVGTVGAFIAGVTAQKIKGVSE